MTALVVAGCAGGGNRLAAPLDLAAWTPTAAPVDTSAPTPAPSATDSQFALTLAITLRLAGAHNLDVALMRARAAEAADAADAADASWLPYLAPRVGFGRHEGRTQATEGRFLDVDKQSTTAGAAAGVVLDPGEALFASLAAQQRADAASARATATEQARLAMAAQGYFELAAAHAMVALAADEVRFAAELALVVQGRVDVGATLQADLARARARLAEANEALEARRGEAEIASAALVELLHLQPGVHLIADAADAGTRVQVVDDATPLDALLTRAFAAHPELRAAEHEVQAAAVDADRTGWGWLVPGLEASAAWDAFGPDPSEFYDRENYFVGLQWRVGFGLPAQHAAANRRVEQSELGRSALRARIAHDVARARVEIQTANARLAAAKEGVRAADELVALVQARHAEGAALLLEVLEAQAVQARARATVLRAISAHNVAQYALLAAVGGAGVR